MFGLFGRLLHVRTCLYVRYMFQRHVNIRVYVPCLYVRCLICNCMLVKQLRYTYIYIYYNRIYTYIYIYIYIFIRVRGSPERDILSLRTLGLGLAQIWVPSAGAVRRIFWQIWHMFGNQRFFHDWAPEKRSQRATTGKLLGITLRVFFWEVQTPKTSFC